MSGGGIDYVHYKIFEAAEELRRNSDDPMHQALANHLDLVGEACCRTDRILASDASYGSDHEAIEKVLNINKKQVTVEYLIKEVSRLQDVIKEIDG